MCCLIGKSRPFRRGRENHPTVEIVSRDRSSEYAAGISKGAPQALQVAETPCRVVCKDRQETNKQKEGADALPHHDVAEQKHTVQALERHQETSSLRGTCYTGTSTNTISPSPTLSGWLLFCPTALRVQLLRNRNSGQMSKVGVWRGTAASPSPNTPFQTVQDTFASYGFPTDYLEDLHVHLLYSFSMNDAMAGLAHDKGFSSSFEHHLCPQRSLLSHPLQVNELSYVMNHTSFIFDFAELAFSPFEPSYHLLLLIADGRWDLVHQHGLFVTLERNSSKRCHTWLFSFLSYGDLKAGAHAVRRFHAGFQALEDRCASGLLFGGYGMDQ
jgi:hypothetical protein